MNEFSMVLLRSLQSSIVAASLLLVAGGCGAGKADPSARLTTPEALVAALREASASHDGELLATCLDDGSALGRHMGRNLRLLARERELAYALADRLEGAYGPVAREQFQSEVDYDRAWAQATKVWRRPMEIVAEDGSLFLSAEGGAMVQPIVRLEGGWRVDSSSELVDSATWEASHLQGETQIRLLQDAVGLLESCDDYPAFQRAYGLHFLELAGAAVVPEK